MKPKTAKCDRAIDKIDSPTPEIARNVERKEAASRIFLLSPANLGGKRAKILLNPQAQFLIAQRLRAGLASLGEAFGFLSGLYFRGKLAYAKTFSRPSGGVAGSWVITSNRGLLDPAMAVDVPLLESFAQARIDAGNVLYRKPLIESARWLKNQVSPHSEIILLGSIATNKYVEPLGEVFGGKLLFPADFLGRGDMSRGALMLRSVAAFSELGYSAVSEFARKGGAKRVNARKGRPPAGAPITTI